MRSARHEWLPGERSVSRREIGLRHDRRMPDSSPASDFRLYHGNSLEVLAGLMAETLREPAAGAGLLAADTILIPQVSMRRWLQNVLAQTHGIAANLRFLTPGEFVREVLAANLPGTEDAGSLDAATLQWRLYALLCDPATLRHPALAELSPYLNGDDALKPWSLAGELANVFEKYQAWRRDWLLGWEAGLAPRDWQAELWRRAAGGLPHRARRIADYLHRHGAVDGDLPVGLPSRVFAFACINVSPDVLRVLSTQARVGTLHFYLPTPCRKYWGDLRSLSERLRDRDDESVVDADATFAIEENPLLEAWGAAGRDFVAALASYEVVHPSGEIAAYADPEENPGDHPENDSLLQRLQRDLLHRRAPAATPWRSQVDRTDATLQVHACHTRLREVQVLHDQLRSLLEADPTLEPRDIAVLTPDIDPYVPHIEAVFGGAAGASADDPSRASQYLLYAVADGSPLAGEPLADVFLRLLGLPQSRFGVAEILDLLAVPAIAERFDLAPSAQERLRHWLGEAGARWGLDAQHRVRHDAPDDAAFTWQFALDRLLMGYASGEDGMIAGVAPWPELEGGSLDALDALIALLRVLARCERTFAQSQSPAQWQQQLLRALDELLSTRPREFADQRTLERLRDAIEEFRAQADAAKFDAPVPPEIVRAYFKARLSAADTRAPFLSGGITFCRMVPMRLIPFRVICLLGMNDGDAPRRDPAGALNRLAAALGTSQRQRGDRSLREDDRFLFLQLLVAANDVFYLSYLGADPRDNSPREPSVLVGELLDVAARYHAEPKDPEQPSPRKQLVVHHPLQPFASQAFGAAARDGQSPEPRRFSYRSEWHPGALATQGVRTTIGSWISSPLPASAPVDALSLVELRTFLRDPADAFLRQRLALRLPDEIVASDEIEPLVLPHRGLQRHRLQQAVFAATVNGDTRDLQTRLHAQALLPSGPLGRRQLDVLLDEIRPYADAFLRWNGGAVVPAESRAFDLDLDGVRLHGRLDALYPGGLARFRFDTLHGPAQIAHGLDWLVLSALGEQRPLVQFAGTAREPGPHLRMPISQDRASAALRSLVTLRAYGLREPLPFLPRAGWLWYDAHANGKDGWDKAGKQWHGSDRSWGEAASASAHLALRGRDPFADAQLGEEFRQIACIVFDAVVHGRDHGAAT
jgi:exodeoxyribonuclease V gamma subunit